MIARPLAGSNAIEAVAFVLTFAREFTQAEIEFLLSLQEKHKAELPSFLKIQGLTVNLADSTEKKPTVMHQTQKFTGVLLQHFQETGKPDWALRVSNNIIVVNCWLYTRWDEVWPKAKKLLLSASQVVDSDSNGITSMTMQTVDKFEYDGIPSSYSITDVFNAESPFLTKKAIGAGTQWHVHQGWFENLAEQGDQGLRRLNVINLASALHNEKLVSTIDHVGKIDFLNGVLPAREISSPSDLPPNDLIIDQIFNELHEGNVNVLLQTLSSEMLNSIGLKR